VRRRLVHFFALALAIAMLPALTASGSSAQSTSSTSIGTAIDQVPVSFTVRNVNRSKLACATDGRSYTVRGHLVGPRDGIGRASSVTMYMHGLDLGEWFWTLDVRGASFAERQARAGHVSLVIDRLGYDSSNKPYGFKSCLGGQADIAHQIVDQLRSGSYTDRDSGSRMPSFTKVVLAGHSVGGLLAELTAYSFNDVDAIIVASYSDQVISAAAMRAAAANAATCRAGGQSTEGSAPGGYAFFAPTVPAFRNAFFVNADRETIDVSTELRNRNPCGDTASFAPAARTNVRFADRIHVPVLVIIGQQDALFPPPAGPRQAQLFTGSNDVTLKTIAATSHGVTLERTAPEFAQKISTWLDAHGFGH